MTTSPSSAAPEGPAMTIAPVPRPRTCSDTVLYVDTVPHRVCRCHPDRYWEVARPSLRVLPPVTTMPVEVTA